MDSDPLTWLMGCGGAGVGVPLPACGDPLLHPGLQHRHQVRALTSPYDLRKASTAAHLDSVAQMTQVTS